MKRKVFLIGFMLLICFIVIIFWGKYQEEDSSQHNIIFTYQKQKEIDHIMIQDELISLDESKKVYQVLRKMELVESSENDNPYVIAGGLPMSIFYVNNNESNEVCLFSGKTKINGTFFDIINESKSSEETFIQQIRNIMDS